MILVRTLSFGIVAIEVWEYDEYDGTLKIPGGGHWVSQYFEEKERIESMIEDTNKIDTMFPGVCLAGKMWEEQTNTLIGNKSKRGIESINNLSTNFGEDSMVGMSRSWVSMHFQRLH